jgi:hypothetical protein
MNSDIFEDVNVDAAGREAEEQNTSDEGARPSQT